MARKNCWEFFKCGREINGEKTSELGVCPAATDVSSDGINHGKNGGRICWAIAGTLCDGEVQGIFAEKHLFCGNCRFYRKVKGEEGFLEYQILKQEQLGKKDD